MVKEPTQDYKEAIYWYKKAAEKGDSFAQFNLALMYYNGKGITQNYKKAYIWWSIAAAQGDKSAAKNRDTIAKKIDPSTTIRNPGAGSSNARKN